MLHEHVERRNFHNNFFLKHCMFYILFPISLQIKQNLHLLSVSSKLIDYLLFIVVSHQQIYRIFATYSRLSPANLPNICY